MFFGSASHLHATTDLAAISAPQNKNHKTEMETSLSEDQSGDVFLDGSRVHLVLGFAYLQEKFHKFKAAKYDL